MSFRSTIVAAALLASAANAHVTMQTPVIFSQDKALIDTAPITAEQYPCHSQYGFTITKMNPITVGSAQTVTLKGSAIHGGGSCQLSVTTDKVPTKDSKFKVIKSYEGDCPATADAELKYTLPASIPNGQATFAWTWFSLLSGGPEMYMNCAPIEVSGGASDTTGFDALPDMLIANIGSTTCSRVEGSPIKFPNPGSELVSAGDKAAVLPTGDCGATGNSTPASTASSAPAASSLAPAVSSSAPSTTSEAAVPSTTADASVVAPVPSDTAAASVVAPVPSNTAAASVVAPVPASTIAATPVASTAPVTGGTTCSTNGAIVCNGTTQFGLCNNGSIVWQAVAAGTTCANGAIQKRDTTFKSSYNGRIVRPKVSAAYRI